MKFLITAGPTREPIDPVRFISNRSSGKMGYALAVAARDRGHEVMLVSGPVALSEPESIRVERVTTASEMCAQVEGNLEWCDVLVMAAAVADYRPAEVLDRKMKKSESQLTLRMERTTDILLHVLPMKGSRYFAGFAAETHEVTAEAERKLRAKGLDLIVANDVSRSDAGFEVDSNTVTLISKEGAREEIPTMNKSDVAKRIVIFIEKQFANRAIGK